MFKATLLMSALLACGVHSNPVDTTARPLSVSSGYIYRPPQGATINYDAAKNYNGQAYNAWPINAQYPQIKALADGFAYNTGLSALASPGHGYQWNQGYTTPGPYYNPGYYNNNYYTPRPYGTYQNGAYGGYGGWNYNRPYYPSIQNRN